MARRKATTKTATEEATKKGAAAVKKEEEVKEPQNLRCHICGYERQFIRYGEKLGKDGRTAKWPIYEECPNKLDPKKHPTKRNRSLVAPINTAPLKVRSGPEGFMYQVVRMERDQIENKLADFQNRFQTLPERIYVADDVDLGEVPSATAYLPDGDAVEIELENVGWLTPGFRYIFMVAEGLGK